MQLVGAECVAVVVAVAASLELAKYKPFRVAIDAAEHVAQRVAKRQSVDGDQEPDRSNDADLRTYQRTECVAVDVTDRVTFRIPQRFAERESIVAAERIAQRESERVADGGYGTSIVIAHHNAKYVPVVVAQRVAFGVAVERGVRRRSDGRHRDGRGLRRRLPAVRHERGLLPGQRVRVGSCVFAGERRVQRAG